jgi:hypothetical protein
MGKLKPSCQRFVWQPARFGSGIASKFGCGLSCTHAVVHEVAIDPVPGPIQSGAPSRSHRFGSLFSMPLAQPSGSLPEMTKGVSGSFAKSIQCDSCKGSVSDADLSGCTALFLGAPLPSLENIGCFLRGGSGCGVAQTPMARNQNGPTIPRFERRIFIASGLTLYLNAKRVTARLSMSWTVSRSDVRNLVGINNSAAKRFAVISCQSTPGGESATLRHAGFTAITTRPSLRTIATSDRA